MSEDVPTLGEDLEIEDHAELSPFPRLLPRPDRDELWRSLRPGDRVRLEAIPNEFLVAEGQLPRETLAMYRHLVETGEVLTVHRVDPEDALPWTLVSWERGGAYEHHYLALNHGGLARVEGA